MQIVHRRQPLPLSSILIEEFDRPLVDLDATTSTVTQIGPMATNPGRHDHQEEAS
jgi:hypothetical protein